MPTPIYGWDTEILRNYFCVTFVDVKTKLEKHIFVISPWQNDYEKLVDFLFQPDLKLVGFNSLGFDYPLIHPLITDDLSDYDGATLANMLYERAAEVLSEDFRRDYAVPLIPQLDLYRIWHFNNKARMTSLKYLQINMNWPDVREMPHSHTSEVKQGAMEQEILDYNLNDVLSTIEFYYRSLNKIKMRTVLGQKYGKDFRNLPDTKIGESIFLNVMSKITGKSEKELSSRRTKRKQIVLKDAIPEGVYFASDQFNLVLKKFQEMIITNTRKEEKLAVIFDDMTYEFGFGGLHALRKSGTYDDVDTADVGGYYPSLSESKLIYPHHLGPAFCQAHGQIKAERKEYKKGTSESDGLKLAGNGVFGMMNAEWSPFFDPLATMKTTIGGQLLLAQLCEWLTMGGAGRIIMVNTDGFEIEIYDREKYEKLCNLWQKEHNLTLEFGKYKTIAIRDVNNYIGVKTNGDVKEKGDFVTEPEIFKDQSMRIVTRAVREYFVNGTPIEQTINETNDIKAFMMGKRAKTGNLELREFKSPTELVKQDLPKNVRYYVSTEGMQMVKVLSAPKKKIKLDENGVEIPPKPKTAKQKTNMLVKKGWYTNEQSLWTNPEWGTDVEDMAVPLDEAFDLMTGAKERIVGVHVGWKVTLFNKWIDKPFDEYHVNKQFYIEEARKLVDAIILNNK
jgi:hypothetical protein